MQHFLDVSRDPFEQFLKKETESDTVDESLNSDCKSYVGCKAMCFKEEANHTENMMKRRTADTILH